MQTNRKKNWSTFQRRSILLNTQTVRRRILYPKTGCNTCFFFHASLLLCVKVGYKKRQKQKSTNNPHKQPTTNPQTTHTNNPHKRPTQTTHKQPTQTTHTNNPHKQPTQTTHAQHALTSTYQQPGTRRNTDVPTVVGVQLFKRGRQPFSSFSMVLHGPFGHLNFVIVVHTGQDQQS